MTNYNWNPEDDWTPNDPYQVADDLKAALEAVLYKLDLEIKIPPIDHVQGFYPDNIKINKLSYEAIDKLDLPLVRTWYRYGQYEPYRSLRAEVLKPGPLNNKDKQVTTASSGSSITRYTIFSWFMSKKDDIKEMWQKGLFDFMRENYSDFAPSQFEDLYIANTDVLESLEDSYSISDDSFWIDPESFLDASLNLKHELKKNRLISEESKEHVRTFLDTFEQALIAFEGNSRRKREAFSLFERARTIYHEYVWKLPAMEISVNNTEGPIEEVSDYDAEREIYIKRFKRNFPKEVEKWEKSAEGLGLSSSPESYRAVFGEIPEEIGALERAAINYKI